MPRSAVTIRDVAALAGVSHQTVSRVINGYERVNPDTRQRVQAAIDQLGYQPNVIARSMALGRTYTLACIVPNLVDFTFSSIIEGAQTEARRQGYFLLAASAPDARTFASLIEQLFMGRMAEGLFAINPYMDDRHTYLPANVPVVFLGARPRGGCFDMVSLDDLSAGAMATRHLLELGHRRIAHITGPMVEDCAQDRQAGMLQAMAALKPDLAPAAVVEGDWSASTGYEAVQSWLAQGLDFSAIFAQNDRMAVGAIRALRDAGRRVPGDVSVIGFDDIPLASYFDPPLTTMHQDIEYSGAQAARLLIRRLEEPGASFEHWQQSAQLVVRCTTASVEGGEALKPCDYLRRSSHA